MNILKIYNNLITPFKLVIFYVIALINTIITVDYVKFLIDTNFKFSANLSTVLAICTGIIVLINILASISIIIFNTTSIRVYKINIDKDVSDICDILVWRFWIGTLEMVHIIISIMLFSYVFEFISIKLLVITMIVTIITYIIIGILNVISYGYLEEMI